MSTQRLYLGSGEENVDGGAVKAAEKVDIGEVNTAMPDVNPMHNPDADEFKQAIAEQDSEMETQKDFMKVSAEQKMKREAHGGRLGGRGRGGGREKRRELPGVCLEGFLDRECEESVFHIPAVEGVWEVGREVGRSLGGREGRWEGGWEGDCERGEGLELLPRTPRQCLDRALRTMPDRSNLLLMTTMP